MIKIPQTRIYKGNPLSNSDIINSHWEGVRFWVEETTDFFLSVFNLIASGKIISTTNNENIFNHIYGVSAPDGKATKETFLNSLRTTVRKKKQINKFYLNKNNCNDIILILKFLKLNLKNIITKDPKFIAKKGNKLLFKVVSNKTFFEFDWRHIKIKNVLKKLNNQYKFDILTGFLNTFQHQPAQSYTLPSGHYRDFAEKYFFTEVSDENKLLKNNLKHFWDNNISILNRELIPHLTSQSTPIVNQTPSKRLENIKKSIVNGFGTGIIQNSIIEPVAFIPLVNIIIQTIFDYDRFSEKGLPLTWSKPINRWQAYNLSAMINMDTCPYCNINYTHTIIASDKNISRPDFDHFFIKSKYPLLAISFYNLIPSCKTCNSTLKGDIDTTLEKNIHPYIENFGNDGKFDFKYAAINNPIIKIRVLGTKAQQKKINGNKKVFRLEDVYNTHKNVLSELLLRLAAYNEEYIKNIATQFKWNPEDLYQFVFGTYFSEDIFYKKPFSKMIKDIVENQAPFNHGWNWKSTR